MPDSILICEMMPRGRTATASTPAVLRRWRRPWMIERYIVAGLSRKAAWCESMLASTFNAANRVARLAADTQLPAKRQRAGRGRRNGPSYAESTGKVCGINTAPALTRRIQRGSSNRKPAATQGFALDPKCRDG